MRRVPCTEPRQRRGESRRRVCGESRAIASTWAYHGIRGSLPLFRARRDECVVQFNA